MSDASQPLIEKALAKIAFHQGEIAKTQAFVNQICEFDGREPMFADVAEVGASASRTALQFGPDDFFNKPMATAVREVLTARKTAGMTGPASIDDLFDALKRGGFNFASNDVDKQKMGLAVSLGKNTVTFRKLPSGLFGLAEWYGNGGRVKAKRFVVQRGVMHEIVEDDPQQDEAPESPDSDSSEASVSTPYSADEDGREVEHDNMNQ